jgi:hypothetical protein
VKKKNSMFAVTAKEINLPLLLARYIYLSIDI